MGKTRLLRGLIAIFSVAAAFSAFVYAGTPWPDLTVLTGYPNPSGPTCSIDGTPGEPPAKAAENRLKNCFKLPLSYTARKLTDILALPPASGGASVPASDPMDNTGATVVGYVRAVKPGGTLGESCNCGAKGKSQVDTHIELVLDPMNTDPAGKGMMVVEVTERSRRLAKKGLLTTTIGNNWSRSMLNSKLLGRWVKFSGWMFYDPDHHLESWAVDPTNTHGKKNWRGTCWEVHPVMGIEVLPAKPADL